MIKAIVFDCFGVLTTDEWRDFVDNIADKSIASEASSLNQAFGAGFIDEKEFIDNIINLTGVRPPITEGANQINKNHQLLKYIRILRKKEYKIGLLSNIASNWIRDEFLNKEEQKLFDEMLMSYEVGITKPNTEIFQLMCNQLGVIRSQAIMIDDIESYCLSAESIGMKSIVYKNFEQLKKELENLLNKSDK